MTPEQIEICNNLGLVKCLPGTFDKRMCRSLSYVSVDKQLSDKQNEWMFRLLYKYRKQLPNTYEKYKNNPFCSQLKK